MEIGIQGVCVCEPTGEPYAIGVGGSTPLTEWIITHEIGHCLEFAIQKTVSEANVTEFDHLRSTIKQSAAVVHIQAAIRGTEILLVAGENTIEQEKLVSDLNFLNYLIEERELFARSYCQYIAVKTDAPDLVEALEDHRIYASNAQLSVSEQWSVNEFVAIEEAFDTLFETIGWKR